MVRLNLKGLHCSKPPKGNGRVYWYAWRGGPRLRGEPGSPEFMASYHKAVETRRTPDPGKFRALVTAYKASPAFTNLAVSTAKNWTTWLDRISAHFGDLRITHFDRPEAIRPCIREWRAKWERTPRTADYALQVLSCVLSYAVDKGKIARNPCEGIKRLYGGANRADRIWTEADIAALKQVCSPEIAHAVDLASHTGLRLGDLLRLSWAHVGADAIIIATSKSRGVREAIVPRYDELNSVLAAIPKRSPTILTNSKGRPWTRDGFGSSFNKAKIAAGLADRDLHFHDMRGTAATRFYLAELKPRAIAEIMGWEEEHVEKIIRRYVDRTAAIRATIAQLNKKGT